MTSFFVHVFTFVKILIEARLKFFNQKGQIIKKKKKQLASPPRVPSSKYQMFNFEFKRDLIGWIARLNIAGPRGSPCWQPTEENKLFLYTNLESWQ